MSRQNLRDDRTLVSTEELFDLLVCDLKILRKILCIVEYYFSLNKDDTMFNDLLTNSLKELKQKIRYFHTRIQLAGIDSKQNINEVFNGFEPAVEGRICLFASNGIFMDTLAGFQTRDISLNVVNPFVSIEQSYFILEHIHEALNINCGLRITQIDRLLDKYKKEHILYDKLKIIRYLMRDIGKYSYEKHHLYESMIRD